MEQDVAAHRIVWTRVHTTREPNTHHYKIIFWKYAPTRWKCVSVCVPMQNFVSTSFSVSIFITWQILFIILFFLIIFFLLLFCTWWIFNINEICLFNVWCLHLYFADIVPSLTYFVMMCVFIRSLWFNASQLSVILSLKVRTRHPKTNQTKLNNNKTTKFR